MGATYYFNLDVSGGDKSGDSEANAFDGSATVTLPDGSSNSCRLNNVVAALQSGDTLWVKKSTSDITFHASNTTTSANDGPTNFVDGGTSYGKTEVYGYGGSTGDGIRATVNLGGKTWQWKRSFGCLKNFNFYGTYTGAGIIQTDDNALIQNCRIEHTSTTSESVVVRVGNAGLIDRCEIISNYSTASPSGDNATAVYLNNAGAENSRITNCYVEARNGANGIFIKRASATHIVAGNIVVTNLDTDGAGNDQGDGIKAESLAYSNGSHISRNIIHNANNGINLEHSGTDNRNCCLIEGNIFSSCATAIGGDAHYNAKLNASDTTNNSKPVFSMSNFYWSNTANSFLNGELNPTFLSSDPFVDYANKNFTITGTEVLTNFGYASSFTGGKTGASGSDTTTANALVAHQAQAKSPSVISIF